MLVGDRHDVDEAQTAHRVDVVRADEPRAHQAHPDARMSRSTSLASLRQRLLARRRSTS